MKTLVYRWLKANITIFVNAGSMVGTTLITSILGFVYWWVAARQFPPDAVGFTSAALSAMTLLGTLSVLGLGTLLIGELPRQQGKEASLIGAALLLVGTVGGCLGVLFALFAPFVSVNFQPLRASLGNVLLFAAGVSFTAITLVLDQALIGLLRGDLQLGRNTLFAVAKLVILFMAGFWLSHTLGLTIYTTWTLGNVFSVVALAGIAALKGKWRERSYRPQWDVLRKLGSEALKHHLLNLTLLAPAQLMPILVAIVLSTTATAWFYVSFMLANFIFIIPVALTMVLYAVSSAQPATLANKARLTIGLATVICLVANGVLWLGAKQILGLFGHSYAEQAAWSLRIMGLGAFPLIVRNHYLAIRRIHGQVLHAMLPMIVAGCFELTGVVVGALVGGLAGLSLGWLIAISVVAVGTSRTVYKALQPVKTFIKASDIEDQQAYTPYAEQTQLLDMQANEVKMGQGEYGKGKLMIRKSSLNILMVTARYFPYMGGIETHVHETARRLVTHGVNVTLLTTAPHSTTLPPKEEVIEGIHVLRVRAWPPQRDYYIAPEIYSIVEGGGWDIVHCQGCHTFVPPIAMLAARKAQIPYVLTFHTGGHSSKWRNSIRGMQWQLLRPLFAGAAKLIGVSHFETDYFRNLLGLPAHLFTVIPNGATLPNIMSPSESTSTQSLIVSVGRLERYKGHQHIITALPHIRKQLPDAKLLIVGIGPYEAALRALAQRVSVAEHVEIRAVPSGNRQEMAKTLVQASLVVLLSEYEAHPIAVMEALALRRPVLVTNTSGLQELGKQQFVRTVALGSTPEEIAVAALRQIQEPLIPTQLALPTWEDCTQQLLAVYNMSVRREQCVS